MDSASFAVWRRLQSIRQEYRLILQELRHTPLSDYQRCAQLTAWACACTAEYIAVLWQWHDHTPR
jgi:hypothetical protein